MRLFWGIITYFMIWWLVIFAVLPWGVRHAEKQELGMMPGAPLKPDFKRIFLRTSLLAFVIWFAVYLLAEFDVISFSRMADALHVQLKQEGRE